MKLPFKSHPTQQIFNILLAIFTILFIFSQNLKAQGSNIDSSLVDEVLGTTHFNFESHQNSDWAVDQNSNQAGTIYRGSNHSVINWKSLDADSFLDIDYWKVERIKKDRFPLWKEIYRAKNHQELVGKVISCFGQCRIYRGSKFSFGEHMSQILERDEIHVMKNSSALIMLNDGSLLRISANTQLMINEMNVTKDKYFYYFSLIYGHIFWEQRFWGKYQANENFETDSAFRPLLPIENNFSYFQKNIYQQKNFSEKRLLDLDPFFALDQFVDQINLKHQQNNKSMSNRKDTEVLLVAANYNLNLKNAHFHAFSSPNREGYFKVFQKDKNINQVVDEYPEYWGNVFFRGYANLKTEEINLGINYQVDFMGKSLKEANDDLFIPVTYLSSRSYSIWHYRESEFFKLFPYAAQSHWTAQNLGENFGLRIWNIASPHELERRKNFLFEHTRRHMTTFLKHRENLPTEQDFKSFSVQHYLPSMNQYFKEIKSRFSLSKELAKEANDLEFYIYVLKQNKLKKNKLNY
jgi:hypothetical protein